MAELSCPVALLGAVAVSDRIVLPNVSRVSGARLRREFVDAETGEAAPREDQVKGYETESGEFVEFEPEEIAALVPDSDKKLCADRFVPLADVDLMFLDRPYFLAPAIWRGRRSTASSETRLPRKGGGPGAGGAVPAAAPRADPAGGRRPDRHDAGLRP